MFRSCSDKHLVSWAGICPGNNESAGKVRSSRVAYGNTHLKTTLIEAAWAASHIINPFVTQVWCAKEKATMTIAHNIPTNSYHNIVIPYLTGRNLI